jgi:archaellum component FlaC
MSSNLRKQNKTKKEGGKNLEPITVRDFMKTYIRREELKNDDYKILGDLGNEKVLYVSKDCITGLADMKTVHKKRLDVKNEYKQAYRFNISKNSDPVFNVCKKWLGSITESVENLEETRILYKKENLEPVSSYYLTRCIIHLVNIIETISEMSKRHPDILKGASSYYFRHIVDCIIGFKNEFSLFCNELNEYINELEHIDNNLSDISKLYNYAITNMDKINVDFPQTIDGSIKFINGVCGDINDLKRDIICLNRSNLRTTYV